MATPNFTVSQHVDRIAAATTAGDHTAAAHLITTLTPQAPAIAALLTINAKEI